MNEVRFSAAGCRSVAIGVYVIFFRPTNTGVEIARVLHGSRDLGTLSPAQNSLAAS